jgi:hypothetical protein
VALPQKALRRRIALHASDVMEKLATNWNELKTTGVRSSSYKFVVDVIVDFKLVRASYMKFFGI